MQIEKKIIGTTVATGIVTAIIVAAGIVPSVFRINGLTEELNGQYREVERRYAMRSYVKSTLTDIEDTQKQLAQLKKSYVVEGDELEFIKSMEGAAERADVEQDLSLETVNETELTLWEKEIPVRIRLNGSFPGVMSWLEEVEKLSYLVIIEGVSINSRVRGGVASPDGEVDALVTGRVLWLSESAPYFVDFEELLNREQQKPATPRVDDDEDELS